MTAYSCFTFVRGQTIPELTIVVATSLDRARAVVRRELLKDGGVSVEICHGDRLLCVEAA
jgi:hypothetical protein